MDALSQKSVALKIKDEGNAAFKGRNWSKALYLYTKAITVYNQEPSLFTNRAQAHIKLESYGLAINDATRAIQLDADNVKAYYRRAVANSAILNYQQALLDLKRVIKLAPQDKLAQTQYNTIRKLAQQQAFLRAIEVSDAPSVFDSLDIKSMFVDDSYDGVRLDKCMTQEFIDDMIERFKNGHKIHRKYVYQIVSAVHELSLKEPTLVEIDIPAGHKITVCGDTHGQFFDLLEIFRLNGHPSPEHYYLFNGDFVDRGSWSTEVALLLFAYRWMYPKTFLLNRGNHEADDMNKMYGFEGECKAKYSEQVFKVFSETFAALPLATLIGHQYFVVHGGLFSNDDVTLDSIRKIDRYRQRQPGDSGLMMEMLWTDPQTNAGRGPSKRGVGLQFGPDVTESFCKRNGLKAIIRSHEVRMEGYEIEHDGRCITVFSAPKYCDTTDNKGAYINIASNYEMEFHQFEAVPHPPIKPMAYASNGLMSFLM